MPIVAVILLIVVAAVLVGRTVFWRRQGYNAGGRVIVRCSAGHVFSTLWVPGISLKAVRLGSRRFQRCPVGHHWAMVQMVRDEDLTDSERQMAAQYGDSRIP